MITLCWPLQLMKQAKNDLAPPGMSGPNAHKIDLLIEFHADNVLREKKLLKDSMKKAHFAWRFRHEHADVLLAEGSRD
jgi:hypothetical protein